MAMGKRKLQRQNKLWIPATGIPATPGHPFYQPLNAVLATHGFDAFVEVQCQRYYAEVKGRHSLAHAVCFPSLLIGYFESIDSERGIAWRLANSLSLREYCGYSLTEGTPNHSTISRNRRLISVETHCAMVTKSVTFREPDRRRGPRRH
jgi:transposase